jgi:integrase
MPRRKRLTDEGVRALPVKAKRYAYPDPELAGHYVRVTPTGVRTFYVVRKNEWTRIGDTDAWPIEKAREKARAIIRGEGAPDTTEFVIGLYRKQIVNKLRSARVANLHLGTIEREFKGREFSSIRRSELANLGDRVAAEHGNRSAEYCLVEFGALSRWYALRSDTYSSPMVRGMTKKFRTKARERVLSDAEIRTIWTEATKRDDNFGTAVRLLLLTGQRLAKIASLRWDEIQDGVWTLRTEEGEKPNAGSLVLPRMALDIINSRPREVSNEYVLAGRAGSHFDSFGKGKADFDRATGPLPHWRLHDLRRTARSLMSRAGVPSKHAERVLGHTIGGVEGVYDRHKYDAEKQAALAKLAELIETIVSQPAGMVIAPLEAHDIDAVTMPGG